MKKHRFPVICVTLVTIFLFGCGLNHTKDQVFTIKEGVTELDLPEILEEVDLDKLVNSEQIPKQTLENVNFNEEVEGFPIQLINQIKTAAASNQIGALFENLRDETLKVDIADIEFKFPLEVEKGDALYQLDFNHDGVEEIVLLEKGYEDVQPKAGTISIFVKENQEYRFQTSYEFLYQRYCGIFAYDNAYYLILNYDDLNFRTTKSLELYKLDSAILKVRKNGYLDSYVKKHISINRTIEDFQLYELYKNRNDWLTEGVTAYIDSIAADLMYTDRSYNYFYGNEIDDYDSLYEQYGENIGNFEFIPLHSADVNNDGNKELFQRYSIYDHYGSYPETTIVWRRPNTLLEYKKNFSFWVKPVYLLTQRWFKELEGKTISFSLYRKHGEDAYVLDARMFENNLSIVLADYSIHPIYNAFCYETPPDIKNNVKNQIHQKESVSDLVPDFKSKRSAFTSDTKGAFAPELCFDEVISQDLSILLQEILYKGDTGILDSLSASAEVNKEDFYEKFDFDDDDDSLPHSEVDKIYTYSLNDVTYYFVILNAYWEYENSFIYTEENGTLQLQTSWRTENADRWVLSFQDSDYLIEAFHIPYGSYYEIYTDRFFVIRLDASLSHKYSVITYLPNQFHWQQVYHLKDSAETKLYDYIRSIQDNLTENIYVDKETRFSFMELPAFTGDETGAIDMDKLLRLQSVNGYRPRFQRDFSSYEIDYDNDSIPEYFKRDHFRYDLFCQFYEMTESKTMEVKMDFLDISGNENLKQMWFKKIEGKIYTFQLYWQDDYNFYLTASLIEGEQQQYQQIYLISPEREYSIYTWDKAVSDFRDPDM